MPPSSRPSRSIPSAAVRAWAPRITPIAFLVIKGESVRMLPIAAPASTTADRVVEQLPDLVDKLYAMVHPKSGDVE